MTTQNPALCRGSYLFFLRDMLLSPIFALPQPFMLSPLMTYSDSFLPFVDL